MIKQDLSPISILRNISELGDYDHVEHLRDAWPVAQRGWVKIYFSTSGGNTIPPASKWTITVTKKGRRILEFENAKAPT